MTKEKTVEELLREWKSVCFFDTQLTMEEAADSLRNDGQALVDARPVNAGRSSTWTLYNTNTNEEAILVHAGIWNLNTNLQTGNFVPPGQKAPFTVSENRIQNVVGFKCDVSYTIDTVIDSSWWDHLETFESYIQTMEGFNRSGRERSPWQDGSRRNNYIISSKIFVRKSTRPREPDFELHEWLKQGLEAQKWQEYAINPDRPLHYDLVNDTPVKLENANPPYFQRGDIVWFAFKVIFFVSNQNWSSEIIPVEFMRVASGQGLYTYSVDEEEESSQEDTKQIQDVSVMKRLEEGQVLVPISKRRDGDSVPSALKRKASNGSDAETLASRNDTMEVTEPNNSKTEIVPEVSVEEGSKVNEVPKKKSKRVRV